MAINKECTKECKAEPDGSEWHYTGCPQFYAGLEEDFILGKPDLDGKIELTIRKPN
jgi:hypothetical protein